MRALILIGALALAACGSNDQTDNTQNFDENLTAENIVSNDVTAIDAVTGDAANMAADSGINDIGTASNGEDNLSSFPSPAPQTVGSAPPKPSVKKPSVPKPAATTPPTKAVSNSSGNAE